MNTPYTANTPGPRNNLLTWGSKPGLNDLRILRLLQFAQQQLDVLNSSMPSYTVDNQKKRYFEDNAATSALFAMQLCDPIYNLTIKFGSGTTVPNWASLRPPSNTAPAMRTMTTLQPPVTQRLAPPAGTTEPASERNVEEEDLSEHEDTFTRPMGYVPPAHVFASLGSHVPRIPTLPEPASPLSFD